MSSALDINCVCYLNPSLTAAWSTGSSGEQQSPRRQSFSENWYLDLSLFKSHKNLTLTNYDLVPPKSYITQADVFLCLATKLLLPKQLSVLPQLFSLLLLGLIPATLHMFPCCILQQLTELCQSEVEDFAYGYCFKHENSVQNCSSRTGIDLTSVTQISIWNLTVTSKINTVSNYACHSQFIFF